MNKEQATQKAIDLSFCGEIICLVDLDDGFIVIPDYCYNGGNVIATFYAGEQVF